MHVPFEGPGHIAAWAKKKGYSMRYVKIYENDPLPEDEVFDLLLIMGGPMNVYDYHIHPWMEDEVDWVRRKIEDGSKILGICLGAQIIAAAMDAEVLPGNHSEIGWHPLQFLPALGLFRIWKEHPGTRTVFHWHGDTFEIPEKAIRIAGSQAFPHQGFIYDERVLALQFHLEVTKEAVKGMVENCRDDIVPGAHVQTEKEILLTTKHIEGNNLLLEEILDWISLERNTENPKPDKGNIE